MIKIENLNYIYNPNTPFEKKALDNININISSNEFIGLIGHTGSGKSTFVQHLNGLIRSKSGSIVIDGVNISNEKVNLTEIRQKVGLVFQYPEYQLFEETVYKDIAYGPKNLGLSEEEIDKRVVDSIETVGLNFNEVKDRSPFELSGGQKRRVAIAGVIAMNPKVLILDEPTAGLDPHGRDEILDEIAKIYKKRKITIILVSHNMEDVARLVNRLIVMEKGKIVMDGETRQVFSHTKELEDIGLGIPEITKFMHQYKAKGNNVKADVLTVEEAKIEILKYLRSKNND